jgi:hypothetical protein
MSRTIANHRLTCDGNTKPCKESLKDRGWKWDAAAGHWYMMLVDAHARLIIDGDDEFFRGLGGHKKGCRLTLDGVVRWTSKTYGAPAGEGAKDVRLPDPDGFGWNCDQAGNLVSTRRIPGSAPDDMI